MVTERAGHFSLVGVFESSADSHDCGVLGGGVLKVEYDEVCGVVV